MQSLLASQIGSLLCVVAATVPASPDDGHAHEHGAPKHGGVVEQTASYHLEAVFTAKGAWLYVRDHGDAPLDLAGASAVATFYHPSQPEKAWFSRPLKPRSTEPGEAPDALEVVINLAKVPAEGVKVTIHAEGLPDPAEPAADIEVPFSFAKPAAITVAKATAADQAEIAKLGVCPVSGEDLGAMGGPLKVSRGEQSTFICCEGCLKPIQADPDKYLAAKKPKQPADGHDHHEHP